MAAKKSCTWFRNDEKAPEQYIKRWVTEEMNIVANGGALEVSHALPVILV